MGLTIGALRVRRSTLIHATPERVWEEFTSRERLDPWFGLGHTLEAFEPGSEGHIELSVEIDGSSRRFGGRLLVHEDASELSFENNWHPPHAWAQPTFITIRLTAIYGGTLVELFHHGFERLGGEASDLLEAFEVGWGMNHLAALRRIVEG